MDKPPFKSAKSTFSTKIYQLFRIFLLYCKDGPQNFIDSLSSYLKIGIVYGK